MNKRYLKQFRDRRGWYPDIKRSASFEQAVMDEVRDRFRWSDLFLPALATAVCLFVFSSSDHSDWMYDKPGLSSESEILAFVNNEEIF